MNVSYTFVVRTTYGGDRSKFKCVPNAQSETGRLTQGEPLGFGDLNNAILRLGRNVYLLRYAS